MTEPVATDPSAGAAGNGSLAGFYAAGYRAADASEAERLGRWRALGAAGKAGHVATLLADARLSPDRIVELGCGDGALLAAMSERGIGRSLDGFELSSTAAELARSRAIARVDRIEAYDGEHAPAADDDYDLCVVSHVLEHVPDPHALLAEAARLAPWVLVEVPLEANRSAARPAKRAEAARIGHINFLSARLLHRLLADAGLKVVAELSDPLPFAHHAFFAVGERARAVAAMKTAVRRLLWLASPAVAARAFTLHMAVLAERA